MSSTEKNKKKRKPFELFIERDVLGLEKPTAQSTISNNKPYKIFTGITIIFLILFILYLIIRAM